MEMQKGSNKGGGRRGDGWDKREEEVVGGIMCVCVDVYMVDLFEERVRGGGGNEWIDKDNRLKYIFMKNNSV